MKYCFCEDCGRLRPKTWFLSDKCDRCKKKSEIIVVNRSKLGYLMYALDAITLILITLFVLGRELSTDLLFGIGEDATIMLVFGSISAAMIFGILDIKRTTERASEIIISRIENE